MTTYSDIYTKFMIEYDKANVTSSYPSLTKYEVAIILDKAYIALISQKFTGNNARKVEFEYDSKAVHDIQGLINTSTIKAVESKTNMNEIVFYVYDTDTELMYYISSTLDNSFDSISTSDKIKHTVLNVTLINHNLANLFRCTTNNVPWIKEPVAYIQDDEIHVFVDPYKLKNVSQYELNVTYIKKPMLFSDRDKLFSENDVFELSQSAVEELINLAIVFATEIVESPRILSKSQLIPLES